MGNAHVCVYAHACMCMRGVCVRERGRERQERRDTERGKRGGEGKAWVLRGKGNYALEEGMRTAGRQCLPASQFSPSRILAHSPGVNWSLFRA